MKLTVRPWKYAGPQKETSYSNHPFSGAKMVVSGGVSCLNRGDAHHPPQEGHVLPILVLYYILWKLQWFPIIQNKKPPFLKRYFQGWSTQNFFGEAASSNVQQYFEKPSPLLPLPLYWLVVMEKYTPYDGVGSIWANYYNSETWNKRMLGETSLTNHHVGLPQLRSL